MRNLICDLCGQHNDDDVQGHKDKLQHRLNFHLHNREIKRKQKLKCDGIVIDQSIKLNNVTEVQVQYVDNTGFYITKLKCSKFEQLGKKLQYEFVVRNDRPERQFVFIQTLHPIDKYYISDYNYVRNTKLEFVLDKGEQCKFVLTFEQQIATIGTYVLPIAITIQPEHNPVAYKTVYRDVEITIADFELVEESTETSPFRKENWDLNIQIISPEGQHHVLDHFQIPLDYFMVYMHGFRSFNGESGLLQYYRIETCNMWEHGLRKDNYEEYFHRLLWLEECTQMLGIRQYNMSQVNVSMVRNNVVLAVPGLAEKRPSVLRGDMVLLRLSNERIAYQGVVQLVEDETVHIEKLAPEFISILRTYPETLVDISFLLSRLQLERMHVGVDNVIKNGMISTALFPRAPTNPIYRRPLGVEELFNRLIAMNPQQLIAVESILSCTSGKAPYIIFGPPGTGKTVTLVEAILQIFQTHKNHNILVCAPSNAACDMLAVKLEEELTKKRTRSTKDLFRVHSTQRNVNEIPTNLKYFSNMDGGELYNVKPGDLKTYRIVISTLHLIGKFAGDYSPDMLFIDEAAQTTEPECDIPIGLLSPGMPIVLAGDPKQLGPICGVLAGRKGLEQSLLERLMATILIYQPTRERPLQYNNNFITMLVHNYRSHEDIVAVPNKLFYGESLKFNAHNDDISQISIARLELKEKNKNKIKAKGAAVEFIGLLSKEQRQGHSPSYYNEIEIDMVIKLIKHILNLPTVRVIERDIGVIAPYIRQVVQIRNKLRHMGKNDIQVGTTEAFQGGERRIMIISTVRAQSDLLLYDKKYDLGFVKHERRFNVAITRAKAKLIIIGNPHVLAYDDKCWGAMMDHCKQMNSYYGEDVQRTDSTREKIIRCFHSNNEE